MLGRWVGSAAACAVVAKAVMIPPGISADTSDNSLDQIIDPRNQRIRIPCPACAFTSTSSQDDESTIEDDLVWIQGGANDVALNFAVSEDGERLELNGNDIYPPHFHRDAYLQGHPFYVNQVSSSASEADVVSGEASTVALEITASGLKIESEHHVSNQGDVIVPVKFQILGLERRPIGLDEVSIDLLKTSNGKLSIMKMESLPTSSFFPSLLPPPLDPEAGSAATSAAVEDCSVLPPPICKFKNMLETKISAWRKGHPRPCKFNNAEHELRPPHHHDHPHNRKPHWEHHHHRGPHKHGMAHAFSRGFIAILVPIMAGVTVGLSISFLGLVVGRLVGCLWMRTRRIGRSRYSRIALDECTTYDKIILSSEDEIEALPIYEEAPAYEETEQQQR